MRIVILGLVLLSLGVARTNAASYFVDYVGGSDSNVGTSRNTSWKHCPGDQAAGGTAAAKALVPGDVVYFKGGVTYVFTGSAGIALNYDGAAGSAITYDGNSDGSWGSGRARFTDNRGASGLTAFFAPANRQNLVFKALEFSGIGGASSLPGDTGSALAARFGGGFSFAAGATNVVIDDCVFRELGYWQNQKPLGAASLAGTGVAGAGFLQLTIRKCDFARMARGCDLSGANSFSAVKVLECVFGDGLLWPLDLPAGFGNVTLLSLETDQNSFQNDTSFDSASWGGYGLAPRAEEVTLAAGSSASFSASALASPAAGFQWYRDGAAIPGANSALLTLSPVLNAHAGTYTAVAMNIAGSASSNTIVVSVTGTYVPPPDSNSNSNQNPDTKPPPPVAGAPVISVQPVTQIAGLGTTVTFSVVADGNGTLTYQWYKRGIAIAGATSATLTLASVSYVDIAGYDVVVTNSLGSTTSDWAILAVTDTVTSNVAPTINQQPMSQTVTAGGSVMFAVGATGTPTPTYQWHKNGTPISGATGLSLTLANVTVADAATYSVLASNVAGTAWSGSAVLTVVIPPPANVAPVISQQPASQSVATGANVSFTAAATGTPAPTYQWEKNSVAIAGATSTTLALTNVQTADAANYRLVASNAAGSATSSVAVLTVTAPPPVNKAPAITQQPVSQSAAIGSTASFTVVASGTPNPTYQWRRNGVTISGATQATLTFGSVKSSDAANYRVTVSNSLGSVTSSTVTLTVTAAPPTAVAPVITQHPASQTVLAGANATFSVAASGTPTPTYQWYRNGVILSGATTTTLSLTAVTANNAATYTAVARNSAGEATSNAAVLTVTVPPAANEAPVIVLQPVSQTATTGDTVALSTAATGKPAPTYQWEKNGVAIPGATNAALVMFGVSTNDTGSYRAVISNVAGTVASTTVNVTVAPTPSANIAPTITQHPFSQTVAVGGNMNFAVVATGTPAPSYQWYRNGSELAGATGGTLYLNGVSLNDAATYTAVARNVAGEAWSSAAVLTVTVPPPTDEAPVIVLQPVSQTATTGDTVTLSTAATGKPAPTYQWEKNGVAIPGATNAAFVMIAVSTNDAANYRAVASNVAGSVASTTVTVTVAPPAPANIAPTITQHPFSQSVMAGGNMNFAVLATGTPAPSYQWYRNGTELPGATGGTLYLNGVSQSDAATYTAVARNVAGEAWSGAAVLTVNEPVQGNQAPVITQQPATIIGNLGQSATFTVVATGYPAPTYQWQKRGVDIPGATNSTLTFNSLSYSDSGGYDVVVTNAFGSVSSNWAILVVVEPPK